ncbi:hypothetical protein SAMN05216325_106109 [Nitrosomonas marina]|uniref:Uncharacterized protein n=2 Tax=Nitrosomonas marina TaxID=917 RepID=A0A1H8DAT8_9PROT|nr:hypothetical protein SAMN05216325_106109 [Nitrosomonas marina]
MQEIYKMVELKKTIIADLKPGFAGLLLRYYVKQLLNAGVISMLPAAGVTVSLIMILNIMGL